MNLGISDITPLTSLDYPGKTACILWSAGCNMRCLYCYNAELLNPLPESQDVFFPSLGRQSSINDFLEERKGFLDGVVLSGGECTLNPHLRDICILARSAGYEIKADTNGTNPGLLKEFIENDLIQYIALDYKAPRGLFTGITRAGNVAYEKFSSTLDYLISIDFPFEVRTTAHADLLDEHQVNEIIRDLSSRKYKGTYYLQHYFHTGNTLGGLEEPLKRFDTSKLAGEIPVGFRNFPGRKI